MKKAFTIVELLIVFGLVAVIASLLQPSLMKMVDHAQTIECLNTHRMIQTSLTYYQDDNEHHIVALAQTGGSGSKALVPSSTVTWWPDLLRNYLSELTSVTCPTTTKYGIGMNHPEVGVWLGVGVLLHDFREPSRTVAFADSAVIENVDEKDANFWMPTTPEKPSIFFRTPSNLPFFNTSPSRVYARHAGKTNALFLDGHAEIMEATDIGFEYPKNHPQALWDR